MILLDTNVLSELMRLKPNHSVISWLDKTSAGDLFLSAVTKAEIELGISLLPDGNRKRKLALAANEIFDEFPLRSLPFDDLAASKYAQLVSARTKRGLPISVEDGQIAAIALVHGLALATRNVSDFKTIDGLRVINPWE